MYRGQGISKGNAATTLSCEKGKVCHKMWNPPCSGKHAAAQDFIPPDEMARLLAQSNSETAQAQAAALEEQQRIQADNVGHRMLQAMGWKEGQGLGAQGKGMAAPVAATGSVKKPYEKGGLGAAVSACPALSRSYGACTLRVEVLGMQLSAGDDYNRCMQAHGAT